MKKKLIDSLKALPMTMEDKEKFAEVICSKSSFGGSNSIFKWRYYDAEKFTNIIGDFYLALANNEHIDCGLIINKVNIGESNTLVSLGSVIIGGSGAPNPIGLMILDPIMTLYGLTNLYEAVYEMCEMANLNYEDIISTLEAAEVTEEEFMKDVTIK